MRTFNYKILYTMRMRIFGLAFVFSTIAALLALSVPSQAGPPGISAILLSRMPSELKPYAIALGSRLQRPGKERIVASGTISYRSDGLPVEEPVRITLQIPLKIRLEQEGRAWTFDRNNPVRLAPGSEKMADAIQMLLEDSVEGLFAMQEKRISRRYLGSGFRLEGSRDSDAGMDVVLVTYPDIFRNGQLMQKSYWFDSYTKLLGVVAYQSPKGSVVHVVLEDWRDVAGEKIPFRIERWVDNKRAMQLIFDRVAVEAAAEDGIFGEN